MATTTSTGKVELVQSLGADQVIDYKTAKFEEISEKFDVILDTVGRSFLWSFSVKQLSRFPIILYTLSRDFRSNSYVERIGGISQESAAGA